MVRVAPGKSPVMDIQLRSSIVGQARQSIKERRGSALLLPGVEGDIMEVVKSSIQESTQRPLGRRSFHQEARTSTPQHALKQQLHELKDRKTGHLGHLAESPVSEAENEGADPGIRGRVVSSSCASGSSGDDRFEVVCAGEELEANQPKAAEAAVLPSVVPQTRDPSKHSCTGGLPEIFKETGPILPSETDSPFSSQLPMLRRHSKCFMLNGSDLHHEEGCRHLRRQDYEQALQCMEAAMKEMEKELHNSAQKDADEFAPPEIDSEEEREAMEDPSQATATLKRMAFEQKKLKIKSLKLMLDQRGNERQRVAKEHRITRGLDLTLAYSRVKHWQKVDELCGELLKFWSSPGTQPTFGGSEDEARWILYMVRRAVACTRMGTDHFDRATSYYTDVLKVVPSNRDAQLGLRSIRFLESQMVPAEG